MKCHYQVMGVPFDVINDDLKKVYRRLALQYHPDKNPDNVEEATSKFREIQQAYEVLSDPQERAWYDKHRDAILRGVSSDYKDESLNVFHYFNSSCYSGHNDDDRGFYAVYREVFNKIAAEDAEFMDEKERVFEIPSFGRSDSSYEKVVHEFYAYWQSYCTLKTYTWIDKYDILTAENRKVVKLMEKENKKLRDQARRKRNEEVRTLVAFVRKRDKRVQAHRKNLEEKAAKNTLKAEEIQRRRLEGRKRQIETYKESEWTSMAQLENQLKALESNLVEQFGETDEDSSLVGSDDDDADELDSLYCVACNKYFKTEKAFENHEKSKKHKENASFLKKVMQEEEKNFADNVSNGSDNRDGLDSDYSDSAGGVDLAELPISDVKAEVLKDKKKKKRNVISGVTVVDDNLQPMTEDKPVEEESAVSEDVQPEISNKDKTSVKKAKKKSSKNLSSNVKKDSGLSCSICGTAFSSRNKLFGHLKDTGHAVAIDAAAANNRGSTSTKGKNRRK